MKTGLKLLALQLVLLIPQLCLAEPSGSSASASKDVAISPKSPWGEFALVEEKEEESWWISALLWVPNRFLDLVDVFHVDVGAGPAFGAVGRITKYGQFGYRTFSPASLRIGNFGRSAPFMMERSSEFGVAPFFVASKDRDVCIGEIGAGVDIFIVGGYFGICTEELADFVTGIFFLDLMEDDLKG